MERIVLFRFHKNPSVCENRLKILKAFNPDVRIFGYFDSRERFSHFKKTERLLESVHFIEGKSPEWFWKNGDLAMRSWYGKIGKDLKFDVLNVVEWDLLMLDSLDIIYRNIPKNGIGLTGIVPLSSVERRWDWTCESPSKEEWMKLLEHARKRFYYKKKPFASLGPGLCVPKRFLDAYYRADVPELCHDELRVPLFGQTLGFKLYDTGFYRKWFDDKEHRLFNCLGKEISILDIKKELSKKNGRRVFHPFRKRFDIELIR